MGWVEGEWVEGARCEDAPCCGHGGQCGTPLGGGGESGGGEDHEAYWCDVCGAYHLGECDDGVWEEEEDEEETDTSDRDEDAWLAAQDRLGDDMADVVGYMGEEAW